MVSKSLPLLAFLCFIIFYSIICAEVVYSTTRLSAPAMTSDGNESMTFNPSFSNASLPNSLSNSSVAQGENGNDISGVNFIPASFGNDRITGTEGVDLIVALDGSDNVHGMGGDDKIQGNEGADQLSGEDGNDVLQGGMGSDQLNGNEGHDVLAGGIDDDYLVGEAGNDKLYGDVGDDILIGGPGADYFDCGDGIDVITDFNLDEGDDNAGNCEEIQN